MPITVNENGVLYDLDVVTSNENGVLYDHDTVHVNEGGALYEVFSAEYRPATFAWDASGQYSPTTGVTSTVSDEGEATETPITVNLAPDLPFSITNANASILAYFPLGILEQYKYLYLDFEGKIGLSNIAHINGKQLVDSSTDFTISDDYGIAGTVHDKTSTTVSAGVYYQRIKVSVDINDAFLRYIGQLEENDVIGIYSSGNDRPIVTLYDIYLYN